MTIGDWSAWCKTMILLHMSSQDSGETSEFLELSDYICSSAGSPGGGRVTQKCLHPGWGRGHGAHVWGRVALAWPRESGTNAGVSSQLSRLGQGRGGATERQGSSGETLLLSPRTHYRLDCCQARRRLRTTMTTTMRPSLERKYVTGHCTCTDLCDQDAQQFDELDPTESKRRLAVIVDRIDADSDGKVSLEELQRWVS